MISIIVAASDNDIIGRSNKIPWNLPRDFKNFKTLTTGHTCIMGRKTFESIVARIGGPLPKRKNVIITRQVDYKAPGCVVVNSWDEAMDVIKGEDVFVSGGEAIYAMALPHADRLILTRVHTQSDGDVRLPIIDFSNWRLIHEEQWLKDKKNEYDVIYQIYERRH